MKILQVMRKIHRRGGIARVVYELSKRMAVNHTIHLLTSNYEDPVEGIRVHPYYLPPYPHWLQIGCGILHNTLFIKNYGREYDTVASHDAESPLCDILHKHSVYKAVLNKYKQEKGFKYRLYKTINPRPHIVLDTEQKAVANAKHIIAVSKHIKDELITWYDIPENKITVVYNGVNIEDFHPTLKADYRYKIRKRYRIQLKDIVLLFPSHEWVRKGLKPLIEALPLVDHQRIKLLVAGKGNRRQYEKIAIQNKVYDNVIFAGAVSGIQRYYAASDMMVMPTSYEPFGLTITEAMSSELPVITTEWAGAAELITHKKDGLLLQSTESEHIADRINLLLDLKQRKRIGHNARKTAEKYSWDNQTQKILEIYNLFPTLKGGAFHRS